jgi:hypothetical protein
MGILIPLFAFAAGPSPATTAQDRALSSLDACADALLSREAVRKPDHRESLEKSCPDLSPALRAAASAAPRFHWASEALSEDPNSSELLDLEALMAAPAPGTRLEWTQPPARLTALLKEVLLPQERADRVSWWERFLQWLRDRVNVPGHVDLGWLERIVDALQISAETAKRILYGVLALLVLSLVALFVHELRAAGLFQVGRRFKGRRHAGATSPPTAASGDSTLVGIRALARQRQPAAFLRSCIEELILRGRLPHDKSRTNRELCRLIGEDPIAASFDDLVVLAEDASYGGYPVTDRILTRCRVDAEQILGTR